MKPLRWNALFIFALLVALSGCQGFAPATPTPTAQPSPTPEIVASPTPVERAAEPASSPTPQPPANPASAPTAQAEALRSEAQVALANLPDLPHYQIDVTINYDDLTFEGRQTVSYTNTEQMALDELNFRLFPNGEKAYGNGTLSVSEVTVDGERVEPALSLEETVLQVPLPSTLEPGQPTQLVLEFQGVVPRDFGSGERQGYGIYNFADGVMALANWYPILAVFDDEGWNLDPTSGVGDSVYADAAFYTVDIAARNDLSLSATGVPLTQESLNGTTHYRYVSGPARDFFMILSPEFQHVTDAVDGITVNSYYLPGHKTGGETALLIALDALRVYNQRFGPYPYNQLDVVEAPMEHAAGVEYPGIILIGDFLYDDPSQSFFEVATAHEVAHQWWYNIVGSDVIDEPWLDEALVTYSSAVYFEEVEGENAFETLLAQWEGAYDQVVERGEDEPITKPLGFWEQPGNQRYYGTIVYLKGALFFQAVREEIGDEAFFDALQAYYQMNKFEIATPDELLNAFENAAGRELDDLYEKWLYSTQS